MVGPRSPRWRGVSMLRLFPLGTSRLHWSLEYVAKHRAADTLFPGFGYFQSAMQISDMAMFLTGGELGAPAQYVFRKDASPSNPFDERFRMTSGAAAINSARSAFAAADVLVVEISSPVEFLLGDAAVQGNPNHRIDAPYADVWRTGYYAIHEPSIPVRRVEADDRAFAQALDRIAAAAGDRPVICLSHIYRGEQDFGRAPFARRVRAGAKARGWKFTDAAAQCQRFGFRQTPGGDVDIHHLAWPGARSLAAEIVETACLAAHVAPPVRALDAIACDDEDFMIGGSKGAVRSSSQVPVGA